MAAAAPARGRGSGAGGRKCVIAARGGGRKWAGRRAEGGWPRWGGASSSRSFFSPFSSLFPVPSFAFHTKGAQRAPGSCSRPRRAGWSRDTRPGAEGGLCSRCRRADGTPGRDGGNWGSSVTSAAPRRRSAFAEVAPAGAASRRLPSTSQELLLIEANSKHRLRSRAQKASRAQEAALPLKPFSFVYKIPTSLFMRKGP